ncbi:hypothetical protein ABID99_001796 [Mucilaginibacter sp. OAE612]
MLKSDTNIVYKNDLANFSSYFFIIFKITISILEF